MSPRPQRRARSLALGLLAGAAVVAAAPTATAGTRVPQLIVEPGAVQPGTTLSLTGTGFPRNAEVELLAGRPHDTPRRVGRARTGRAGHFRATIRIRARSATGRFILLACHDDCDVKAQARFRIVAP